jgi:ATP-dependent RNA/DNA helicase IGHMBP2
VTPPRPARRPPLVDTAATKLNDDQRQAISTALGADDVCLIHGPPGTGKTHVLVEVVAQLLGRGERVLCLAASNAAVDHLALGVLERCPDAALARVGDPARVAPLLEAHTLAALTEAHPHRVTAKNLVGHARELLRTARRRSDSGREAWLREREARVEAGTLFAEARRLERVAAQAVLGQCRVLCGTLTGAFAQRLDQLTDDDDQQFDTLVIDEASQALTPAVLLGARHAQRVVLAGDHKQLAPVVQSTAAARGGLAETCFAALCGTDNDSGNDHSVSHMLTVQHRMPDELMAFPSAHSYDGRLQAHPAVARRSLLDLHAVARAAAATNDPALATATEVIQPHAPLSLLDTAGAGFEETQEADSLSSHNPGEVQVVRLLLEALGTLGVPPDSIGVITPYAAQAAKLSQELAPLLDLGLEVDSVDGFQGREKDVVVFSAVRSNHQGEVGFLADPRRLNVALTRARRKLLVVCDSATVTSDATWRALVDHAIATGAHRSVFELPGAVDG